MLNILKKAIAVEFPGTKMISRCSDSGVEFLNIYFDPSEICVVWNTKNFEFSYFEDPSESDGFDNYRAEEESDLDLVMDRIRLFLMLRNEEGLKGLIREHLNSVYGNSSLRPRDTAFEDEVLDIFDEILVLHSQAKIRGYDGNFNKLLEQVQA